MLPKVRFDFAFSGYANTTSTPIGVEGGGGELQSGGLKVCAD